MVGSIASGSRMQLPVLQQALDKLRKPREKTEAETKLDEIITSMKRHARDGGAEAARQKLERIKAKLKMLEMAAASAAASGDAKAARAVARQIKEAAKEMSDALRAAGGGSAGGAGAGSAGAGAGTAGAGAGAGAGTAANATQQPPSQEHLVAIANMDADNPEHQAELNGGTRGEGRQADAEGRAVALLKINDAEQALKDEPQQAAKAAPQQAGHQSQEAGKAQSGASALDDLKAEARSLLAQMRKILEQARLALMHPLAKKQDADTAQDEFRDADQALAALNAASLGGGEIGTIGGIDLKA